MHGETVKFTELIVALLSAGTDEAVKSQTTFWRVRIKFQVVADLYKLPLA
jgi:hypothetical protein